MKEKFIKDAQQNLVFEIPSEADKLEVWALTKDACWAPVLEIDLKGYFFLSLSSFASPGNDPS